MAPTWNGFLDSSLCQEVCHSASSQNCQARYQLGKHLENCNLLEKQVGMRQNRALMYSWHSGVELSIPKFDRPFLRMQLNSLQRSATKAANQLQGWGGAHLRKARTAAWDTRDLKLTRSPPLHPPLLPFQEAHPQNAVPGQVTETQLAQQQEQTQTCPSPGQCFSHNAILVCALSSGSGASCPAHLHELQAHAASSLQLLRMKPEGQENICWEIVSWDWFCNSSWPNLPLPFQHKHWNAAISPFFFTRGFS